MTNMSANIKANPVGVAILLGILVISLLYLLGLPGSSRTGGTVSVSMKELLSAGIDAARLGGNKVKEIRDNSKLDEEVKGMTAEGAKELKTNGDMASHKIMFHGLKNAFPDIKIVSEEHEKNPSQGSEMPVLNKNLPDVENVLDEKISADDITVWIDPLDATQEYTEDLKQYVTTMVCVAVKGQPVIGVVQRAFKPETVWAYVGHGKSPNLQLSSVDHQKDEGYSIIVSRSHSGSVKDVAEKSFGAGTQVIPAGGAGYKTLEVIEGRADAYVHVTAIKKWDICAGDAILRAVNGRLTTLTNKDIDYSATESPLNEDGLLATTSNHDLYLKSLAPIFENGRNQRTKRHTHNAADNYRVAKREN